MPLLESVLVMHDDMEPEAASVEAAVAAKRAARLSLADSNHQKRWFTVHPLVARAARHFPSGDIDLKLLRLTACMCLSEVLDSGLRELSDVRKIEADVEYARALVPLVEPIVQANLLLHIGRFELYAGNPGRALEIFRSVSDEVLNLENNVSEGALTLKNAMAEALQQTADYASALKVYNFVEGCVRQYGAEETRAPWS